MSREAPGIGPTDEPALSIGIWRGKYPCNIGTLMRSAYQLGVQRVFTIGRRYTREPADVFNLTRHVALVHFDDIPSFLAARPPETPLIAVEKGGVPLGGFVHPPRAIYLLGAEDEGTPAELLEACDMHVEIEALRRPMYNVGIAGSIVLWHRQFGGGGRG